MLSSSICSRNGTSSRITVKSSSGTMRPKMLINALGLSENLVEEVTEELYEDTDNEQWYAPYVKAGKDFKLFEEESYFYPTNGRTRAAISENIFRTLVVVDRAIAHYTEDERDAFLEEKLLTDLLFFTTSSNLLYTFESCINCLCRIMGVMSKVS